MRKFKCIVILLFCFFCAAHVMAQKKEMIAARDLVKANKNLDQAQTSMQKLLKDSCNRSNKKIWLILYDAVKKQYEQGNEKLYLKQAYDTAKLFNLAKELFVVAQQMDSVEMIPDEKGRKRIEYRKSHAEFLAQIRPNLYNGGAWFVNKKKYADAYQFFDQYISCANAPLFGHYNFGTQDKRLPMAAYWAVYCGYKMKNPKATLHHSYEALKDTTHFDFMLQYLAETYKLEKDTARYEQTLKEGFQHSPQFPFFFPRLVEFYSDRNQLDSAMIVVNRALEIEPESELYLFTKGTILLNQGKNEECAKLSEALIAKGTSLPEVYYNAGLAYLNRAVQLDKNIYQTKKQHSEMVSYYKKALPFMQKYREMEPNEQSKWSLPLYTIYLNLNMGKEFDEIDKLIRTSKK